MKNMLYVLLVLLVGCSMGNDYTEDHDVSYSVEALSSGGVVSGHLQYFDNISTNIGVSGDFNYSCVTENPRMVFYSYADDVTITLIYNGVEYSDSGGGRLAITIP